MYFEAIYFCSCWKRNLPILEMALKCYYVDNVFALCRFSRLHNVAVINGSLRKHINSARSFT